MKTDLIFHVVPQTELLNGAIGEIFMLSLVTLSSPPNKYISSSIIVTQLAPGELTYKMLLRYIVLLGVSTTAICLLSHATAHIFKGNLLGET